MRPGDGVRPGAASARLGHVDDFVVAQAAHRTTAVRSRAKRDRPRPVGDGHAVEVVLVARVVAQSAVATLFVEIRDDPRDHG